MKVIFMIISVCILTVFVSCNPETRTAIYNGLTVAYVDTIRQGTPGGRGGVGWTLVLSYMVENESYIRPVAIRTSAPLPKGTPVPIRYQQRNPGRNVAFHVNYPVPINDSIEIYFTRRPSGIHYVLRRR